MKSLGIIPARYASTRFPGKPLADLGGCSVVERVYRQARQAQLDAVVVATDDERIYQHVADFGGSVVLTAAHHASGTDRCAEVAEMTGFSRFDLVVNIQGDEPFIHPGQIDAVLATLENNAAFDIATLAKKVESQDELHNPNVVKVVFGQNGRALYFSRSPIPFLRGLPAAEWLGNAPFYKHIGLYAYRRQVLVNVAKLPLGQLEKAESLEQLRWLENGYTVGVATTGHESRGIDMPEDLEKAIAWLSGSQ